MPLGAVSLDPGREPFLTREEGLRWCALGLQACQVSDFVGLSVPQRLEGVRFSVGINMFDAGSGPKSLARAECPANACEHWPRRHAEPGRFTRVFLFNCLDSAEAIRPDGKVHVGRDREEARKDSSGFSKVISPAAFNRSTDRPSVLEAPVKANDYSKPATLATARLSRPVGEGHEFAANRPGRQKHLNRCARPPRPHQVKGVVRVVAHGGDNERIRIKGAGVELELDRPRAHELSEPIETMPSIRCPEARLGRWGKEVRTHAESLVRVRYTDDECVICEVRHVCDRSKPGRRDTTN